MVMQSKLNRLLSSWQKGTVRTSYSLRQNGYSDDLLQKYAKSKWLESFGYGAYKLNGDKVEWYGALFTLQTELDSTIHVGGKSALQLKGFAHTISDELQKVNLFHNDNKLLPKWFRDHTWNVELEITKTSKCGTYDQSFLSHETLNGISIKVSSPELAIMEMLLKVPGSESYNEADLIMNGLMTLRPKIISNILLKCKSVKAKRLFLYLAEKHNHPWFKKLDLQKFDLGKGKRSIVSNGMLDSKYQITVPRESNE